jgi:hypothetical protein
MVAAMCALGTAAVLGPPAGTASAACTTGPTTLETVTGVVVSTTIEPGVGVLMTVRADDGTDHTVRFAGRDPNNTLPDGSENPVEDAWFAPLPPWASGTRWREPHPVGRIP